MKGIEIPLGDYPPEGEPYTAMVATNRQAVLCFFDECREQQRKYGKEQECAFEITMPCGYSRKFGKHEEIPHEDLPCPCGRVSRHIIRYEKGVDDEVSKVQRQG